MTSWIYVTVGLTSMTQQTVMVTDAQMDRSIDWLIDLRIKGGMTAWSVWSVCRIIWWLVGLKDVKKQKYCKNAPVLPKFFPKIYMERHTKKQFAISKCLGNFIGLVKNILTCDKILWRQFIRNAMENFRDIL